MKIEIPSQTLLTDSFDSIKPGDTFWTNADKMAIHLWLKCDNQVQAVRLFDGLLESFEHHHRVIPASGKFVIES